MGHCSCSPLPIDLDELKSCITDAINSITFDIFQNVYEEFDYRSDACHTGGEGGATSKICKNCNENLM